MNPTDAGGGVREQLVAKGNLPRASAPRPAEALTLRLPYRPSGLALDAEESQHRPAGHRATAVKGTHPFTGTHAQGGLPCATTDLEPGGYPRKRSAGVSTQLILGSQ